jgi:hypothetical protein
LPGIAEAVLGVLGFAGLISSVVGAPAIKAGAIVATLIAITGLFVVLTTSRSRLHSQNQELAELLRRYCHALETRYHHMWRTTCWRQFIAIDHQGNTTEEISFTIVADSEFVDYVSVWCGSGWAWPTRLQKRVRYNLTTALNGTEGGVRPVVTDSWYDRDELAIIAHLREPLPQGSTASFELTMHWPQKCARLTRRGEPEEFARTFPHTLDSLHYAVELPPGYQARVETFGLKNSAAKYRVRVMTTRAGGKRIALTAERVPAEQRVGMRIDPT